MGKQQRERRDEEETDREPHMPDITTTRRASRLSPSASPSSKVDVEKCIGCAFTKEADRLISPPFDNPSKPLRITSAGVDDTTLKKRLANAIADALRNEKNRSVRC